MRSPLAVILASYLHTQESSKFFLNELFFIKLSPLIRGSSECVRETAGLFEECSLFGLHESGLVFLGWQIRAEMKAFGLNTSGGWKSEAPPCRTSGRGEGPVSLGPACVLSRGTPTPLLPKAA